MTIKSLKVGDVLRITNFYTQDLAVRFDYARSSLREDTVYVHRYSDNMRDWNAVWLPSGIGCHIPIGHIPTKTEHIIPETDELLRMLAKWRLS